MRRRILVTMMVAAMMVAALPADASHRSLEADLSAANEVGGGDGSAIGSARIRVSKGEVCFSITTHGLSTAAFAAHIHEGAAGVNGAVVLDFDWATNGGAENASGCVAAESSLIRAIRQQPENYYVNVHNSTVPSGAVRGQLHR